MTRDRAALVGTGVAAGWLVALMVIDVALPPTVVPDALLGLAPLIACAVLPVRPTALFAGCAALLVLFSGWYNHTWGTAEQWIRLADVLLTGGAAIVIAGVRVRREQHLARVTTIAEVAQRAILPTLPGYTDGVAVASRYLSASRDAVVGGDLYDCCLEGYTRFVVGDVRGKGLAGVEHAARVIRAFRQAAPTRARLGDVAVSMHAYLRPFLGPEDFVTALLVDVSDRDLVRLTSCGHPPALLVRRDGTATLVEVPHGLPLGLGVEAGDIALPWSAGDRLLLYTDGLSEARDPRGLFLPVRDAAPLIAGGSLDEALDALLARVRAHVPGGRLDDDLAVVLLENRPVAEPAGLLRVAAEEAGAQVADDRVEEVPADVQWPSPRRAEREEQGQAQADHDGDSHHEDRRPQGAA